MLQSATHEPNRVMERFHPVSVTEIKPDTYVFDRGKNMTGWVSLRFRSCVAGQCVTLRHAEAINEDGTLNCSSAGGALQEDRYIMSGVADDAFEYLFTCHEFQYVEVTGYPGAPDLESVEGCFVHSAVETIGHFECTNELINRIHRCTVQACWKATNSKGWSRGCTALNSSWTDARI